MKGYSKIKGNPPFIPRSKSNKEFLFLDTDFELLSTKKSQLHDQEEKQPRLIVHEDNGSFHHKKNNFHLKKNKSFFLGRTEDYEDGNDDHQGEISKSNGGFLKRNSSVKKNNINVNSNNNNDNHKNISFERQSSTRAIQEAVKRAFSINRSSSVNSDRYSRIYDQPISINVDDYDNNNHVNDNDYDNQDYDFERIGSLETRSMKKNHDGYGKRHVGSKVMRACKRLFSR